MSLKSPGASDIHVKAASVATAIPDISAVATAATAASPHTAAMILPDFDESHVDGLKVTLADNDNSSDMSATGYRRAACPRCLLGPCLVLPLILSYSIEMSAQSSPTKV